MAAFVEVVFCEVIWAESGYKACQCDAFAQIELASVNCAVCQRGGIRLEPLTANPTRVLIILL